MKYIHISLFHIWGMRKLWIREVTSFVLLGKAIVEPIYFFLYLGSKISTIYPCHRIFSPYIGLRVWRPGFHPDWNLFTMRHPFLWPCLSHRGSGNNKPCFACLAELFQSTSESLWKSTRFSRKPGIKEKIGKRWGLFREGVSLHIRKI